MLRRVFRSSRAVLAKRPSCLSAHGLSLSTSSHANLCDQQPVKAASALTQVINAVARRRISLQADDIYKLCVLLAEKEDSLGLKQHSAFVQALVDQRRSLDENALTPFQAAFVDRSLGGLAEVSATAPVLGADLAHPQTPPVGVPGPETATVVGPRDEDPTVEARLSAIKEIVHETQGSGFVGTDDMARICAHCDALALQLRKMSEVQISRLTKYLAMVNYKDFKFTALLSRRCCELAPKFTLSDACRVYHNLMRLNTHDSLVAIVNQIEGRVGDLTRADVQLMVQALERQQQTSSAPTRLIPKLVAKAVKLLPEVTSGGFHRAALGALARYSIQRTPAASAIVADLPRVVDSVPERDLLHILQATIDLQMPTSSEGFVAVLRRVENLVATMDIRNIDQLVDILSVCSCDTASIMNKLLDRIADDAGRLSQAQVVFLFDVLSGYPPARGHAGTASLSFAASLRSDSFDGESLEKIIISMSQLHHFTDEFFVLAETLLTARGGFRSFQALHEMLSLLTPVVARDTRAQSVISRGILMLAPSLSDENVQLLKKDLLRLGVEDRNVHQKLFSRVKQLQREIGSRRHSRGRTSDPADDYF